MRPPIPEVIGSLLRRPNPAVIATIRPDGTPQTVATWYELLGDDQLLLNLDAQRIRLRHIRSNPAVALTILDIDSWYRHISLRGRVTDLRPDVDMREIDRLSIAYLGVPYQKRQQDRLTATVTIEEWFAWDARSFSMDGTAGPATFPSSG